MNTTWRVGGLLLAVAVSGCSDPNTAPPSVPPIRGQGIAAKGEDVPKGKKPQASPLLLPD